MYEYPGRTLFIAVWYNVYQYCLWRECHKINETIEAALKVCSRLDHVPVLSLGQTYLTTTLHIQYLLLLASKRRNVLVCRRLRNLRMIFPYAVPHEHAFPIGGTSTVL